MGTHNLPYHITLSFLLMLGFLIIECRPKQVRTFSEKEYTYYTDRLNEGIRDTGINSYIEYFGISGSYKNGKFDDFWYDSEQSPENRFSIYALPPDSFYIHYAILKEMSNTPKHSRSIDSILQRALDIYAMALKVVFINENIFINKEYFLLHQTPILLQKLEDYNYNTFDFNKIDEDTILYSEKARYSKEKGLFRCKNCLLWNEFIHFYTWETKDSVFFDICKRNACKF